MMDESGLFIFQKANKRCLTYVEANLLDVVFVGYLSMRSILL